MGSHDGAEVCELVGLLILNKLQSVFKNENIGLYSDDALAAFRDMGPRTANKVRKRFIDCFTEFGLKITIQTNRKIVNYLDIPLNLTNGTYQPYRKPENAPLFIHTDSNHPPSVKKQVSISTSDRISKLSCSNDCFETLKIAL